MLQSCNSDLDDPISDNVNEKHSVFYRGVDLSYVNEMEDCGAVYKNSDGILADPYDIFKDAGANLVRLRLWHSPDWTNYSNLKDVRKAILRARNENMDVLLNFHYSDTWADPNKQQIPEAWKDHINNLEVLKDSIYNYTYNTLESLANQGLLPEIVQVGNEINPMILQDGDLEWPINWNRNATLLNEGIRAIRDISSDRNKDIQVMLHIAQPENAIWWFEQAVSNGVTDFDWIGLSYYPKWSEVEMNSLGGVLSYLIDTYDKPLMVVETAYPYTLINIDAANNIQGEESLIEGYPATEEGQYQYLEDLKKVIADAGGSGLVYWEPAWVSTNCKTLWGVGSHWDNATLFNHDKVPTKGLKFLNN